MLPSDPRPSAHPYTQRFLSSCDKERPTWTGKAGGQSTHPFRKPDCAPTRHSLSLDLLLLTRFLQSQTSEVETLPYLDAHIPQVHLPTLGRGCETLLQHAVDQVIRRC